MWIPTPPNPNDAEKPIVLGLSGAAAADAPEASLETLTGIHRDEIALARQEVVKHSLLVALILGAGALMWFMDESGTSKRSHSRSPAHWLIAGAGSGTYAILKAWRALKRLRALDPAAVDALASTRQKDEDGATARHKERLRTRRPYFSIGLIICFGVVLAAQTVAGFSAFAAAGLANDQARAGDWWRLVTGQLLHANQLHLWLDGAALLLIGGVAEAYGPKLRVPLVFLLSGVAGGAVSLFATPHASWVGASPAILGLAGYVVVLVRRRPSETPAFLRNTPLAVLGMAAFAGLIGLVVVDTAAHIAGALTGALFAWLTVPREIDEEPALSTGLEPGPTPVLDLLGWIATVVLLAATAFGVQRILAAPRSGTVVPISFYDVTIVDGVGHLESGVTVVVSDRVLSITSSAGSSQPPPGMRQFNASGKFLAAATFDRSEPSPLDGLRHVWVGQIFEGAPGDVVISSVNPARGRVSGPTDIVAAVVGGRYYSNIDLKKAQRAR